MDYPAFTSDNLTSLNEAISLGAKKVKYSDKEIEYHSVREMIQLRSLMLREIGASTGGGRKFAEIDKGL